MTEATGQKVCRGLECVTEALQTYTKTLEKAPEPAAAPAAPPPLAGGGGLTAAERSFLVELAREAVSAGAADYFSKPYNNDEVLLRISIAEQRLRHVGARPASCWQLLGAGAVGGQTLLGLPMVHRLLASDRGRVDVWPFTTGLRAPVVAAGTVVIAELWPSMLPPGVPTAEDVGMVRDEAQVRAAADWLASAAAEGTIADLFTRFAAADTHLATDFENSTFTFTAGASRHTVPFTLSGFDRALVNAGGWVEYADANY